MHEDFRGLFNNHSALCKPLLFMYNLACIIIVEERIEIHVHSERQIALENTGSRIRKLMDTSVMQR